ncbi:MAG: AAA family ATPase, partial [Gammaproteobacteria bacterium]
MGWIESLDEARASGLAGAVLTFNTGDRVFCEREGGVQLASLKYFLAAKYAAEGIRVGYYSLASRFTELSPQEHRGAAPSPFGQITAADNALFVLRDLDPILKDPDSHSVVVIDYAEHLASAQLSGGAPVEQSALIEKLHDWSLDDDIKQSGNFIILISRENALHHLVRHESGYRMIAIDLPDATTRRAFTAYLLRIRAEGKLQHRLGDLGADLPVEDFARITSGLRLSDIEELLCHAGGLKRPITRDGVRVRKRQTIDQLCHGLVEVIEPTEGFESVAGCRAAKEYFNAIKPLWLSGHGSLPQGILLAGTPGSGKSFLIKALAMELGVPCLVMRGVREQWVGASERNMDRVLQVADSLAPCIFWTDELDQQLGGERSSGPSGDSGVNGRLLGRILEFFGDSRIRGRILWLATTNRPDLLDAAIKDRFSIKIPFLHPSRSERAALLPVLAAQVGRAV